MPPTLSEDEIDDLLYFARMGDADEYNQLKDALCKRENATVAALLESARDEMSGNGVLHMAAANDHHVIIQSTCKELSSSSPQDTTILAVLNAQLDILNSQNKAGNTALHWAALNGHLDTVKVLLDQGADPTIQNHKGHDVAYEAELNDKTNIVEWILTEGGAGLEKGLGAGAGEDVEDNQDFEVNGETEDGTTGVEENIKKVALQEAQPDTVPETSLMGSPARAVTSPSG